VKIAACAAVIGLLIAAYVIRFPHGIPPKDSKGIPAHWCPAGDDPKVVPAEWCWPLPYSLGPTPG
jgi:hypothetical protein